jgi:hypothetical protein
MHSILATGEHMAKLQTSRSVSVVLSLFMLLCDRPQNCRAQASASQMSTDNVSSDVTFVLNVERPNSPVRIAHIFIGEEEVTPGKPIHVSGLWVSKIRVLVENKSPKEIIAGIMSLSFPETGDGTSAHPMLGSGAALGRTPALAFRRKDGSAPPIPGVYTSRPEVRIQPGSMMDFKVDPHLGDIDQRAAYRLSPVITTVKISVNGIYFADGSRWTGFDYYVPADPPLLWRKITFGEFSGEKATQ